MKLTTHMVRVIFLFCLHLLIMYPVRPDIMQKSKPVKKIKVFLLAGQSNMEGRANANKLLPLDLERLSKVKERVQLAFNNEPICPLKAVKPSAEIAEIYKCELIFGPELFFGIALSEAWPEEKILLIKLSEGSTSLHGSWHPEWSEDKAALVGEENGPKLYRALIDYIDQTLSEYKIDEYEICAMLWVQGETDAGNKIAAAAYGQNLQQFINHIRKDLEIDTLPFLLFQVGHGKVVEGMMKAAQLIPYVTLISQSLEPTSADFYPKMENGHYNHEGMKKLGQRFMETFLNSISDAR
jgi:Carbohydrate esterase, sialic acid-specific acetylesterase